MTNIETVNEFIKNYFEKNSDKNYFDCTKEVAKKFEMDFVDAYCFVSNYASKKWEVK